MPRPLTDKLTEKQSDMLVYICQVIDERGFPPSYSELGERFGITKISARGRVRWLEKKGYVLMPGGHGNGRHLSVLRRLDDVPCRQEPKPKKQYVKVPLLGTVVAGLPLATEEMKCGVVFADAGIPHIKKCYAVEVCGESMEDAGFASGDILLVHPQPLANDGDIVVASLNGEVTVKTLRFRDQQVALIPANKSFQPIPVTSEDDFRVLGVVQNERPSFDNPQAE